MNLTDTFARFVKSEQFGGVLLLGCTIVSLLLANSPFGAALPRHLARKAGPAERSSTGSTTRSWPMFFLLIGLELEREIYVGELSRLRKALLPAFAAVGRHGRHRRCCTPHSTQAARTQAGFGIPMATDIAFALGVLALLGSRVPPALKVFIVAFAVIDDLGAIVLIAAVYTARFRWPIAPLALGDLRRPAAAESACAS